MSCLKGLCVFSAGDDYGETYRNWSDHPIRNQWDVLQDLGTGAFSAVVLARHVETKRLSALKIIFLDNPDVDVEMEELLTREGELLKRFNHPNIVSCHAVYKGHRAHVLELEVLSGGHVFDKLHGLSSTYSERDVASVFVQIAEAVAYMHRRGVLHRDIKPENVVFARPPKANEPPPPVKLLDLGMAVPYDPLNPTKGCLGTAGFIAPEIVRGEPHTPAMDVYALGVLLFVMLVGRKPFNFSDVEKLKYAYMDLKDAPGLKDPRWLDLSPDAKQLLMGLLATRPERRLVMKQVLEHEWVVSRGGLVLRPLGQDVALGAATVAALRRLRQMGVGAVALPAVVRATTRHTKRKGGDSAKLDASWAGGRRQQITAEHRAFLDALQRAKKHSSSSLRGGGVMHSLARSIAAKSYQTLHDHSVRDGSRHSVVGGTHNSNKHNGTNHTHPIIIPDKSVRSSGSRHNLTDPSVRSGTERAGSIQSDPTYNTSHMRRAATSLLLTDLLGTSGGLGGNQSSVVVGSELYGSSYPESSILGSSYPQQQQGNYGTTPPSVEDFAAYGMTRSHSAMGIVNFDETNNSGLDALKASVRQYLEVKERSLRGGNAFFGSGKTSKNNSMHGGGGSRHGSIHNVGTTGMMPGIPLNNKRGAGTSSSSAPITAAAPPLKPQAAEYVDMWISSSTSPPTHTNYTTTQPVRIPSSKHHAGSTVHGSSSQKEHRHAAIPPLPIEPSTTTTTLSIPRNNNSGSDTSDMINNNQGDGSSVFSSENQQTTIYGDGSTSIRVVRRSEDGSSYKSGSLGSGRSGSIKFGSAGRKVHALKALE